MPVSIVDFGTGDYPFSMITVPGLGTSANWEATKVVFEDMVATDEDIKKLTDFLTEHNIERTGEPAWLLSAYFSN